MMILSQNNFNVMAEKLINIFFFFFYYNVYR